MVLFVMLCKVVYTCKFENKTQHVSIYLKAIEQCIHVVLFVLLYKIFVTFKCLTNP